MLFDSNPVAFPGRGSSAMRIGVFADAHDHLDNVRHAVAEFNRRRCELVMFAGDFVSPMVPTVMRRLNCPVVACFGDNDGNKIGIAGGMRIVGEVGEPPFGVVTDDGTRILLSHVPESVRGLVDGFHVVISAHTHKPRITRDEQGRLFLCPGETSGWTYRKPTVAILETQPLAAEFVAPAGNAAGSRGAQRTEDGGLRMEDGRDWRKENPDLPTFRLSDFPTFRLSTFRPFPPRTRMTDTPEKSGWIGFDLGGTKMLGAVFDDDLQILARRRKNPGP